MKNLYTTLLALLVWTASGSTLLAQSQEHTHQDDMACPHCRHKATEAQTLRQAQAARAPQKARLAAVDFVTTFTSGGLYRIKSQRNLYMRETPNHTVSTAAKGAAPDYASTWILELTGKGYKLRNANTGRLLQSIDKNATPLSTGAEGAVFHIRKGKSNTLYHLSWKEDFSGLDCMHEDAQKNVVRWSAGTSDTYSNWSIEPVSDISPDQVRTHIATQSGYATSITDGATYRLVNAAYTDRALSADYFTGKMSALNVDKNSLAQVWKLENQNGNWKLRSIVSDQYIANQGSISQSYQLNKVGYAFRATKSTDWVPNFAFGGTYYLHAGANQGYSIVAWHNDQPASRWCLEPVEVDAAALAKAKAELINLQELATHASTHTANLAKFFADKACTQLQANYANMSDEQLVAAMKEVGLPAALQQVALRIKNDKWSDNAEANRLEKDFRIAEYQAYSDHGKWMEPQFAGTGFKFSRLTSPTGITVDGGQAACIFVDQAPPAGCTLKAELVTGFDTTGKQVELKPGFNVVSSLEPAHIYIYYNIDNTNLKLAACPKIKIHIEGGRANGYFDASRHTNEDWKTMKKLTALGFLEDETFRLKSTYYCLSLHLDQTKQSENNGAWSYNGKYRGLTGILQKMDEINKMERDLIGADQFADRFNCMHFASSAGIHDFLYATTYGIFLKNAGTFLNYKTYAEGGNNYGGGDLWAVAHETGHHFQRLFDLAACVESSVNLFSNIAVFNQGSNVSRGPSMLHFIDLFNKKTSWADRGLGDRILPYYQLWLYFEQLGHHPRFYKDLSDKFRRSNINKKNANTDYLKFARTVCDVVQEDLTEFFEFHGFLSKDKVGNVKLSWGDAFYDTHYGPVPITISASDIDATRRYMAKYPKKNARNLLFIDDRIRKSAATHEAAKPGQMRWGTTQGVVPGVASSVGDVGMYHDFGKDATTATLTKVTLSGRTVSVQGTGIVGYKVYDAQGKLVYVSNRNSFTLPASVDLKGAVVKVASGNGDEITVIQDGQVLNQFIVSGIIDTQISAPASSSAPDAPIYDLSGRRVKPTQGGLYIQGGKIKVAR